MPNELDYGVNTTITKAISLDTTMIAKAQIAARQIQRADCRTVSSVQQAAEMESDLRLPREQLIALAVEVLKQL